MTATVTLKRSVSYYGADGLVEFKAGAQIAADSVEPSVLSQWARDGFIEGGAAGVSAEAIKEARLARGTQTTPIGQPIELKSETDPALGQDVTGTMITETSIDTAIDGLVSEEAAAPVSNEIKVEGETVVATTPIDAPAQPKAGKVTRAKDK